MSLTLLACLAGLAVQPQDTLPSFPDSITRQVVERAMERHRTADSAVTDYSARLRYRLSFGIGRRRWGGVPSAAVEEQEGTVTWAYPNDLRVEVLGRRARARSQEYNLSSSFDSPWFVPRALGDSVRFFGNDFPSQAALHPLASDAATYYRYRIVDSLTIRSGNGQPLRLVVVEVAPRRSAPALIAGRLWLDAETSEVVRLTFRYVGTQLWVTPEKSTSKDSAEARRANRLANRILQVDADLEYGLQEGRHWMPFRQVLSGMVELPWIGDFVLPFEAVTSFADYEINTGRGVTFTVPLPDSITDPDSIRVLMRARRDSLRADRRHRSLNGGEGDEAEAARDEAGRWPNGRFEIHRAPADSLAAYHGWSDSLVFDLPAEQERRVREAREDLERLARGLPAELTGRSRGGFGYERLADAFRYNRVQGVSLGLGYKFEATGIPYVSLSGTGRYGLSDKRLTLVLAVVRDAPDARWTLRGYRDIRTFDPFARGPGFANGLNAVFAAHDDADYHLAEGGSIAREGSLGRTSGFTLMASVERETSVTQRARSGVNDLFGGTGRFPPNPPIEDGTFGLFGARLDGFANRARWMLGGDLLAGTGDATGRVYAEWQQPLWRGTRAPLLGARAGIASRPTLPQAAFRLGGEGTVRGFDYGTRVGQAFWAVQGDLALTRGWLRPVVFADVGQAGAAKDLFRTPVLAGAGAGVSVLGGFLRFDLSHPLTTGGHRLRFDVVVGARR